MVTKEIVKDKDILGGVPIFRGTRIPVSQIFALRSSGMTDRDIMNNYAITKKQIDIAYRYAAIELNGKNRK
ncbi:MAG: DUF433 domain-containing protein [Candidatus Margulisbacteria bacterium]|nr:DUF433 domain-containing protein [Candidatus Margulisiibacteriota bacterium]